ncbi:MAG TPA: NAD(P)H-dependent oxidoreductase [Candidatus Egerieicola faecale]|uniref:NAD(P)H-dependent oxidoreductase n=1 Tax=Candidatus Egerieicola faecale TaxID=2840774 RepID=A0A9D1IRI9_9FIRM|nr:NAD(P)H-dependent oxidoreductase [Candidatus Egerieicola faecale]
MGKTLVAYFSASGVTAKAAEKIAEAIGADLYEIRPQLPYTAKDLDWMNRNSRSSVEMNDPARRPAIAQSLDNMAQYDTILVGFPIWWYVEPRIIDTFLESYDFSGKTMIPFATSGSSGIEKAQQSLQAHCPKAVWEKGQLLNRTDPAKWAKGL